MKNTNKFKRPKEMDKMRKIVKCVNYIEKLEMEDFKTLGIGIEIQDFTEPNLNEREIRSILKKYKAAFQDFEGIRSLHGPFLDLKPSSPDLKIREVSYERYLNAIKYADELDMDFVVFHSQINPYLNEPSLKKLNNVQNKEFWDRILDEINFKGTILIENIFEESPEMLKEYIDEIDRPNIKINLDIGHAKLGKVSLEEWIAVLKDDVAYMHIHTNDGIIDQHQTPSKEEIRKLYKLLEKYNLNPVLSLEYDTENLTDEISKYLGE